MEVAVTIGPENSPTSVVVSITDEGNAYPDFLDDACRRAGTEAVRLYRELTDDAATQDDH